MKKIILVTCITVVFTACGNGSENSTSSDSTVNSTTPPTTSDTSNVVGAMMGDSSTLVRDSIIKK
jgi:ABC-type Zn uptake system ZnuABC Zn-binding protein ZnuA